MRFETEKNMPINGVASSNAAANPNAAHKSTHFSAMPTMTEYPDRWDKFKIYLHKYSLLRSATKTATSWGVIFFDSKYGL